MDIAKAIRDQIRDKRVQLKALEQDIAALEKAANVLNGSAGRGTGRKIIAERLSATDGHVPGGHVPSVENIQTALSVLRTATDGGMARSELEDRTGIRSSTMTGVLGQLVKDGRIEQTNPPQKRGTKWKLTPKEMKLHVGHGEIK